MQRHVKSRKWWKLQLITGPALLTSCAFDIACEISCSPTLQLLEHCRKQNFTNIDIICDFTLAFILFFWQNPDGSLSQAAMMQSALAKERREVKQAQREAEMDSIPTGLNKHWVDPLPDGKTFKLHPSIWIRNHVSLQFRKSKCLPTLKSALESRHGPVRDSDGMITLDKNITFTVLQLQL